MKILSIIPARGGSKGLPGKNIKDLVGKPLIAWTIEASLNSEYITKTIVSSDDDEILEVSQKFGAEVIKRPYVLAQDTTPTEPVIEDVLANIEDIGSYEYLILLQPTSPLRNEKDIDKAIELLFHKQASGLISVVEIDNKVLKAFINNEAGYLEGISNNVYPFMRRQDLPSVYMPNGAIYIIKTEEFIKSKKLFTEQTISYLMSKEKSIDIDTHADLEALRQLFYRNDK